jgi:hypothetical protein
MAATGLRRVPFGIGTKSPAPSWSVFERRMITRTLNVAFDIFHVERQELLTP